MEYTVEKLNEWIAMERSGFISAIGEYTPQEFFDLCRAHAALTEERDRLKRHAEAMAKKLSSILSPSMDDATVKAYRADFPEAP